MMLRRCRHIRARGQDARMSAYPDKEEVSQ